jgi:hypothetical protein
MAISKTRFRKGVTVVPDTDALEGIEGEIKVDSADGKLKATLGGSARELLTNSQSATLTNKTFDADGTGNSITNIENADIKAAAAIDASKIADGSVSNAEFQYINSLTSNAQTQINTVSSAAGTAQTDINNHIADAVDAHDASAISNIPSGNLAATEVQAALNELQTDVDTRATSAALSAHISNATGAHAASAISNIPSGNLAATEVQAALNELQTDVDTRALNSALTSHTGASTGVHGVSGSVVGTSDSQVLTNKTITGADFRTPLRSDVKQDTKANLTTYALTATNGQLVFATDTKELFQIVDGLLKAAGGTGGAADVNALLIQTFDTAAVSDFTQTGLSLSTTNTINGAQSAALTHQAGINQSFKQTITVDRKFRAQQMTLSLNVRSTATSGNLTVQIQDETNAVSVMASSQIQTDSNPFTANTNSNTTLNSISNADMALLAIGDSVTGSGIPVGAVITALGTNQVTISAAATATASAVSMRASALPARRPFTFVIPANCASLSYTVTALPEANSPRSVIDDVVIELTTNSLLETSVVVPVITEWQGYTPTFTGFGTPTSIEAQWRQNGSNVEIRTKFVSGVSTATTAQISLPNGYTSASSSSIPSIQANGFWLNSANNANHGGAVLISPSLTYVTFGPRGTFGSAVETPLASQNANAMVSSGESISFSTSVPVAGLSATTTKTIALTQSGIIQDADSMIRLDTANGFGSTATKIRRFTNIRQNIGSDILYQDSATNGASFTAITSGVYSVSFTDCTTATATIGLSLNSSQLTTNIFSITPSTLLAHSYIAIGTASTEVSWAGYLNAGDIIRPHTEGVAAGSTPATFTISRQGSLKQVSVNPNSKITIPTSELRFEGASSRGAVATAIVKFDTLAKIRGDAFTVTNTANDGTFVTMLKAGRLNVGSNLFAAANYAYLTKNKSVLTTAPGLASENLAASGAGIGSVYTHIAWEGDVIVGDVIRVSSAGNPTADSINNLTLSFQEQDIQVSVSNTLPQFSDSDSSVRLSGANGFGSTATTTRRFANILQNLGTDIQYTDSPTLGGQFRAMSSGIYNVSFTEESNANTASIATIIRLNGISSLAFSLESLNSPDATFKGVNASWSGYLTEGDIITAAVLVAANNNGVSSLFTISKVGKPNVTGVNVTPFVNVPQPDSEAIVVGTGNGYGSTATKIRRFSVVPKNTNRGIIAYSDSPTNGASFTALKRCSVTVTFADRTAASNVDIGLSLNSTTLTTGIDSLSPPVLLGFVRSSLATDFMQVSWSGIMEAGDVLRPHNGTANTTADAASVTLSLSASALSDQILTVPETFSTDTASLQYASSAAYTLATLANAPVGTYITFTYAASTNTRTQTTTAPTQTTADMNANGMLIYTRAYNAASTAAQPAAIAVQIGKGLKGVSQNLYKNTGKSTSGNLDFYLTAAAFSEGARIKDYNEVTGVLIVDAGVQIVTVTSGATFTFSDLSSQTSGYLVINGAKNPALMGMNLNRVAARGVSTSGQSIPNNAITLVTWDASKTFDTNGALNTGSGVFTAPETGYYNVSAKTSYVSGLTAGNTIIVYIFKNGAQYSREFVISQGALAMPIIADLLFLAKGDTVDIRAYQNSGSARSLDTNDNTFSIVKTSV